MILCQFTDADVLTNTPIADTTLFEHNPDNNLGGQETLVVGAIATGQRSHALLRFDLDASLPPGARVTNAVLRLQRTRGSTSPASLDIFRVLTHWNEGAKSGIITGVGLGAPASPGEATWNAPQSGTANWAAPGAAAGIDYSATPSGSGPTAGGNPTLLTGAGMLDDIEFWRTNAAGNRGWIILMRGSPPTGQPPPNSARHFGSLNGTNDPQLIIGFEFPPEPPRLEAPRMNAGNLQFDFSAIPGMVYNVERRADFATGGWETNQILGPFGSSQTVSVTEPIDASARIYRLLMQPAQ